MRTRALLLGVAVVGACAEPSSDVPDECNPLGGDGCLAPWPSMAYAKRDTEFSSTGYRLAIPSEVMPRNNAGAFVHPGPLNRWDGFSTIGPMFAQFPVSLSTQNLPPDPDASLASDSAIVALDMDTGERVPIAVEVDDQTLIVRPIRRLHPGHRHAVAIRNHVRAIDGGPLPIAAGFAALRDGTDFAHPRFAAVRDGASAMFTALEAAGVTRDELVLAWDFVTASDEFVRSDLVAMRNQALTRIGPAGEYLTYTLGAAGNGRYEGTVASPNFLAPNGRGLHRDEWEWDGRPMQLGVRDARFAVFVPDCAREPRPTILVGHALFGSPATAVEDPFVQLLANESCAVVVAVEHAGLAADQRDVAIAAMGELTQLPVVTENLAQSMIDMIAIAALVRGPLARTLPIDPARLTYVGDTLGGLTGATYLAYEPDAMRAAISPAAWPPAELVEAMRAAYPPDTHFANLAVVLGMGFEPYDPRTTATAIPHDLLVWSAMREANAESFAREMALPVLAPSVMSPWGMTLANEASRGYVIFDNAPSSTPALARHVAQVIARAPLSIACALAGAPAPCDCATGACE